MRRRWAPGPTSTATRRLSSNASARGCAAFAKLSTTGFPCSSSGPAASMPFLARCGGGAPARSADRDHPLDRDAGALRDVLRDLHLELEVAQRVAQLRER